MNTINILIDALPVKERKKWVKEQLPGLIHQFNHAFRDLAVCALTTAEIDVPRVGVMHSIMFLDEIIDGLEATLDDFESKTK